MCVLHKVSVAVPATQSDAAGPSAPSSATATPTPTVLLPPPLLSPLLPLPSVLPPLFPPTPTYYMNALMHYPGPYDSPGAL